MVPQRELSFIEPNHHDHFAETGASQVKIRERNANFSTMIFAAAGLLDFSGSLQRHATVTTGGQSHPGIPGVPATVTRDWHVEHKCRGFLG
jgi:hypothetical protein